MKHLFTTLIFCFTVGVCTAQTDTTAAPVIAVDTVTLEKPAVVALPVVDTTVAVTPAAVAPATPAVTEVFRKNSVKMNLSSLALSNYSFSYERAIARKITLVGGYSFTPESKIGSIPVIKKGLELADIAGESEDGEGDEISDIMNEANVSTNAFTGEIRFYTGKKPGARGFYASLYGRYTTINLSHLYVYESDFGNKDLPIKANINGFGGGVMLGAQWLIAKRVTFDWYIIGGHYGSMSGDITAKTDLSDLPDEEKADLEAEIEDIASNGDRKYIDATINDNGMFGKLNGPFGGIRGLGFNIGIAF